METSDNREIPTLEQRQMEVDANRCFNCGYAASNPSHISPLLIALNTKIKTTKRIVNAENSFAVPLMKSNLLGSDELLTEIRLSTLREGTQQKYDEFTIRQSIGFPIVNLAGSVSLNSGRIEEARIVFWSIFPIPLWAKEAEALLIGKDLPRNC